MKAIFEKIEYFDTWRLFRKANRMNIRAKIKLVRKCMCDSSSVASFSQASIWLYSILITKKNSLPEWEEARQAAGFYQGFSRINCWNAEFTCYSVNIICKAIADGASLNHAVKRYNELLNADFRCHIDCSYCVAKLGKIALDNPKCPDYSIFLDLGYPIYATGKIVSFPFKILFFTVALPIYFAILPIKSIVIFLKKSVEYAIETYL